MSGWSDNLGDAADSILRFVESGAGADALALAVVCQVVFGDGKDSTLEAAAARMEQYHNNKPIPTVDRTMPGRVLRRMPLPTWTARKTPTPAQQHLQRADELLRQFRCEDHAYRNRLTLLASSSGWLVSGHKSRRPSTRRARRRFGVANDFRRKSPNIGWPSWAGSETRFPGPRWRCGWSAGWLVLSPP